MPHIVALLGPVALRVAALELDATRVGPDEACERSDERSLAGAIGTHDHKRFALTRSE